MKKLFAALLFLLCVLPYCCILGKSLCSAKAYYDVFLAQSEFLVRFWRSLLLCTSIAVGQTIISVLAGFGFAKCSFKGKNTLFFVLMLLIIMPVQVVLVPNFLVLDAMHLLNTYAALALPMVFAPLGTFIMTQGFKAAPNGVIEAARLDGCGAWKVIWKIALPMNKGGLACTALLGFLSGWNMVEQPMAYLKNVADYPLSVGLAMSKNTEIALVCCVLAALPPLFLFDSMKQELVEGIGLGEEK